MSLPRHPQSALIEQNSSLLDDTPEPVWGVLGSAPGLPAVASAKAGATPKLVLGVRYWVGAFFQWTLTENQLNYGRLVDALLRAVRTRALQTDSGS